MVSFQKSVSLKKGGDPRFRDDSVSVEIPCLPFVLRNRFSLGGCLCIFEDLGGV